MKVLLCAGAGLLLAACSGVAISEPASGGAPGYSESGGAGNAGGSSPGSSGAGGASLGSGGVAGTSDGTGSNPNLRGVVSNIPDARVLGCSGLACPGGECVTLSVSGERECSETVTSSYEYCEPGVNGTHCLSVSPLDGGPFELWVVACKDGSALMRKCESGCVSIGGQGASCS